MSVRHSARAAFVIFLGLLSADSLAQDANAARNLAATCFTCHGTNGVSVNNVPPSLAGLSKDYLLMQLRDFRDGKRAATVMHQQAKGYTDAQFELIAGYFAAQKR